MTQCLPLIKNAAQLPVISTQLEADVVKTIIVIIFVIIIIIIIAKVPSTLVVQTVPVDFSQKHSTLMHISTLDGLPE